MSIAKLIRDMAAAGAPPAAIAIAVEAIEAVQNLAIQTQRSSGAERQARYRERKASQSVTRDVTRDVTLRNSVTLSSPLVPPLDVSPTPPSLTPPIIPPSLGAGAPKNPPSSFNPRKALENLGCEQKHIDGWLKVRQAKRSPLTEAALEALQREADKASIPIAYAVRLCAENGWQSFKSDWKFDRPATGSDPPKVQQVFVVEDSDPWRAWCEYRRRIGANRPFVCKESAENGFRRGNWFPSEYPQKEQQK